MNYDDSSALEYAQDTLKQLQEMLSTTPAYVLHFGSGHSVREWTTMKARIDISVHALQDLEDYIREVLPKRN